MAVYFSGPLVHCKALIKIEQIEGSVCKFEKPGMGKNFKTKPTAKYHAPFPLLPLNTFLRKVSTSARFIFGCKPEGAATLGS